MSETVWIKKHHKAMQLYIGKCVIVIVKVIVIFLPP